MAHSRPARPHRPGRAEPTLHPLPPRWTLALLPVVAAGLLLVGAAVGPSSSTETRYCAMAREMVESGDLVVPRFNGAPLLEKPPFEYWATSTAFRLFGVSDVVARLPHLLAGALVVLLVGFVVRRLSPSGGPWRGRLAALALATMPSFLVQTYAIAPDAFLLVTTTLAGWALLEADRCTERVPRRWPLLLWGACGLSMLVKGPLALVLVGGAAAATALVRRSARILRPFASPLGVVLFAAIAVPWYLVLDARLPGALDALVRRRLFGGMGSAADFHAHGPWTVWAPFVGAFPWLAMVPAAILALRRDRRFRDGPGLPLVCLALAAPVLFSFAAARLASYTSPAYPFVAVLVGLGVPAPEEDPASRAVRWSRGELARATIGYAVVALALAVVVTVVGVVATPAVVAAWAAAAACAAVVLVPGPRALFARPVPRAALAVVLLLGGAGAVAAARPERVGSARGIHEAYVAARRPGESVAAWMNYNGDWGLLPWYERGEVVFFGYPSPPMIVAPEAHRPDLFRPEEALEPWLRSPGRKFLMVRRRDRERLVRDGVPVEIVAAVHEYELLATPASAERR